MRLVAFLWLAALPALGFEFPLTRAQRAQKLVEAAHWQILRGEYQQAIDSCTQALRIKEDWAPALICRSEARMMVKDPQADQDALEAIRLDPKSGDPYRILGILRYETGRYLEAIQNFDEALTRSKIRPDVISDIYYYRARSKFNLGQMQDALKDVERGIGILRGISGDYADWSFYSLRAEILRRQGEPDKADEDERRVVELVTQRMRRRPQEAPELLRRRAQSYMLLREYDHAVEDYGELLSREADPKTLLERAWAYSKAGKHELARRDLDRALELDPKSPQALRLRALERLELGDWRGAAVDAKLHIHVEPEPALPMAGREASMSLLEAFQSIAAGPDSSRAGHKAFILGMFGEHESALEEADRALSENPGDAAAHLARGRAGLILGRCADVAPSLEWLAARLPGSSSGLWLRGECRCALGDADRCIEDLERASGIDPESRVVAARLADQERRYLDRHPERASLEELRRSERFFDRIRRLRPLDPGERLGRARTLLELAELLQDRRSLKERARLLDEADRECAAILKSDPANGAATELRLRIQRLLLETRPLRPSRPSKTRRR